MKLAASAHPQGCVLVTDAISALGLGNGRHMLGDVDVNVSDGKATLAADGVTLAGAVSRVKSKTVVPEWRVRMEIWLFLSFRCASFGSEKNCRDK